MARRGKGANHVWTAEEDEKLVESIVELKYSGKWDGESGSGLKKGYQKELERILNEKLPGHGLKEKPHIESRCKLMKKQYNAIYDVLTNGSLSGFGWDDDRKCVTASSDVWDPYLKSHPKCSFMKNKPFLHYDKLACVWDKDRADGSNTEATTDVVEELDMEQNQNQGNEDSDEDNVQTIPPRTATYRGEDTSKVSDRKRRRSTDGLVVSLEHMTNALTAHMEKSDDQMTKFVESFAGADKQKIENRDKLNNELRKIQVLTRSQRQVAAIKLIGDPNLLAYFFTLEDDDEKETFLAELLG